MTARVACARGLTRHRTQFFEIESDIHGWPLQSLGRQGMALQLSPTGIPRTPHSLCRIVFVGTRHGYVRHHKRHSLVQTRKPRIWRFRKIWPLWPLWPLRGAEKVQLRGSVRKSKLLTECTCIDYGSDRRKSGYLKGGILKRVGLS